MEDYIAINRQHWNAKTAVHRGSDFYNVDGFLKGESSVKPFDMELLGNVNGKSLLHLQCHFGLDTLSLARLGASVTGADLSDMAIAEAKKLSALAGLPAEFVCSDLYLLPENLHKQYDVVYTSYGVLGWLPDMDKWASVVSHFLKPGGMFVLVEFHPVVWMMDYDFERIHYSYFNSGVIVEEEEGTYADRSAPLKSVSHSWNHSLSEVMNSLIRHGLQIEVLNEYNYSPFNCFAHMEQTAPGQYQVVGMDGKLPLVFAIRAVKK